MDFQHDENEEQQTTEREIVPAGVHEMRIQQAGEGPNPYKTHDEKNPEGLCLKLRLAVGDYRFVFDDIPKHLGWRAKQLATALGFAVAGGTVSLEPEDLIGRDVLVEVSHYTGKGGKVSSVVKKYLAAEKAEAAAAKAESRSSRRSELSSNAASKRAAPKRDPRSPGVRVVDAMPADDDDIPF